MLLLELFDSMDVNKNRAVRKAVITPCVDVLQ